MSKYVLGFFAVGTAAATIAFAAACTTDEPVVVRDAGPDDDVVVPAVDAGADAAVEAGSPEAGPSCAGIGGGQGQLLFGSEGCHDCVAASCCKEVQDCLASPPAPDAGPGPGCKAFLDTCYGSCFQDTANFDSCVAGCADAFGKETADKALALDFCVFGAYPSYDGGLPRAPKCQKVITKDNGQEAPICP